MTQQPRWIYLNRKKPYVTYGLIGLNVVMFLATLYMQYFLRYPNGQALLILGAKENTLITCGQYWRLLTAGFLHGGLMHLISNLLGLYFWGPQIEALLGRGKYIFVYLFSTLFGFLLSYLCTEGFAVGASCAIFGLFGALLYFRTRYKDVFDRAFGMQVLVIIGINLFSGFVTTGIDNWGHIGGLVGGFCAAYATGLYREKPNFRRVLTWLGLIAACAFLFVFGIRKYSAALQIPMFSFIRIPLK